MLGPLRVVQVEYPQDWLATPLERHGPEAGGVAHGPGALRPGGCAGDIGTHAINLASFVSGLELRASWRPTLTTFVPGRRLDDNINVLLRFKGGATGMLWASQVAPGNANALRLRVYGEKGGLSWAQEEPNYLAVHAAGRAAAADLARGARGCGAGGAAR